MKNEKYRLLFMLKAINEKDYNVFFIFHFSFYYLFTISNC